MVERKRRFEERTDARQFKTRKSGFGVILVLCVFLLFFYLFYSGSVKVPNIDLSVQSKPLESQPNLSYLVTSFDAQFLEFIHPSAQFKVKYPVGYGVESSNSDPLALKLYSYGMSSQPVLIDFTLIDGTLTEKNYLDLLSSIPNDVEVKSFDITNGTAVFGNNKFYVIRFSQTSKWVNDKLFLTYGFINCPKYAVMVEAIVPETSKDEQFVVNSVLESFECG